MTMTEGNARIASTMLGIEDRGILTASLMLEFADGAGQGFGGFQFDLNVDGNYKGKPQCAEFIRQTLMVAGVSEWEKLKGKHVRARHTMDRVHAIGHIVDDRWFTPSEFWGDK